MMTLGFVLVFALTLFFTSQQQLSLVYVNEISRHGARTPTSSELDPYKTDYGVLQNGDLTPSGMRQHYLVGRLLRKWYNAENGTVGKLYNYTYSPYQVYVQSSNIRRTLNSAYSQLEGLFPPGARANLTEAQALNARPPFFFNATTWDNLGTQVLPMNYQILPIMAYDEKVDPFLDEWCPAFGKSTQDLQKTQAYQDLTDRTTQLRRKVATLLQRESADLETISNLRNGLIARQVQGYQISNYQSIFNDLTSYDYQRYQLILTGNPEMLKIITSNFLLFVSYEFNSTVSHAMKGELDSIYRRRLSFLSYHDDQQVEIGTALGVDFKNERPPFASVLLHQLWHDDSQNPQQCQSIEDCYSQFYVKVKYNDRAVKLVPQSCAHKSGDGEGCRLDDYWNYIYNEKIYHGDSTEACKVAESAQKKSFLSD